MHGKGCANHQNFRGSGHVQPGLLHMLGFFSKPNYVWSELSPILAELAEQDGSVIYAISLGVVRCAPCIRQLPMKVDHITRPGALMKLVNVLRNNNYIKGRF